MENDSGTHSHYHQYPADGPMHSALRTTDGAHRKHYGCVSFTHWPVLFLPVSAQFGTFMENDRLQLGDHRLWFHVHHIGCDRFIEGTGEEVSTIMHEHT